jgi:hypothetical protein
LSPSPSSSVSARSIASTRAASALTRLEASCATGPERGTASPASSSGAFPNDRRSSSNAQKCQRGGSSFRAVKSLERLVFGGRSSADTYTHGTRTRGVPNRLPP